jgi:acetyltransferase-like isoleucine patch superfamily enzyme
MIDNYFSFIRYKRYRRRYSLPDSFKFLGKHIFISPGKRGCMFKGGKNSHIGDYSNLSLSGGNISLGDDISIGRGFLVTTEGFDTDKWIHGVPQGINYGDVVIGNHVWIGHNVFIRGGVKIGDNSVIGYGSIVLHDVPANCVYAGLKVVKKDINHMKKMYEDLSMSQDGTWVEIYGEDE